MNNAVYQSRPYTYTLAAGQQIEIPGKASFARCLSATGAFTVGLNGQSRVDWFAGKWFKVPAQFAWDYLHIENPGGVAITVTIELSLGEVGDDRLTVTGSIDVSQSTVLATAPDVALAPAATTLITAATPTRREISISNDTAAAIRVGDALAGAGRGVNIPAGAVYTLATAAAVYAYSVPGGNVSFTEVLD